MCVRGTELQQLTGSSLHLLQCLCLNMAHGYYPFLFFAALFSKLCINNTSKHFQEAESHTFAEESSDG